MVKGAKRPDKGKWLAAVRRPTPVNLAAASVLLLLPWAVLLIKMLRHQHVDSGAVGLVVTFSLGLPALWLAVAGYVVAQHGADKTTRPSLTEVADSLARRLRVQWGREAEARGLYVPYPLPVFWAAAEAPLAGDLDALKKLATSGAGWSASARDNWVTGLEDLASGDGKELADILATVPTRRLVVLGEPGSGKTMLMVRLVLDLLARRARDDPVPVLATLASWDPVSRDLHHWLGDTLITTYSDLAGAPPPGFAGNDNFEALVEAGLILPVLDGLDEVPEAVRPAAISRINKELKPGEQVVVTCRTDQYRAAVSPQDGHGAVLRAAAVQLSTLEFGMVASYLRQDAGPADEGRWDFLSTLSTESPVRQALTTPLMAGLARDIYNPRPDERASDLRHPAELCDFADHAAVEAHLFDAFIPAAYRPPTESPWTAMQAEKWLVFLARYLEHDIKSPDLAWWELPPAAFWPTLAAGLAAGLAAAAVIGFVAGAVIAAVAGVTAGVVTGAVLAVLSGAALAETTGIGTLLDEKPPRLAHGIRLRPPSRGSISTAVVYGAMSGVVAGAVLGVLAGAVLAAVIAAATVIVRWVTSGEGAPLHVSSDASPLAVLAADRRTGTTFGVMAGAVTGAVIGTVTVALAVGGPWVGVLAGVAAGAVVGGTTSFTLSAWPSYGISRIWLALRHQLPWKLMSFLADAHRQRVLRQAGAVYQFRHIELQHRLAQRDLDPQLAAFLATWTSD